MSKIRHISLILFGICIFFRANAQTDTIYVYEDVVIYDTVVVYDTVFIRPDINNILPLELKSINLLQLDTINHQTNLLLISDQQTATFPINHIILDENFSKNIKNSESMKKLSFFGVVFFAFQAMVLAQTNYEISVGSGIWWENGNLDYVDKPYTPLLNVGVFAKKNFADKHFNLKTGFEYSYLLGSDDYKFDGTIGIWHSENGSEFENINSNYGAGQHNISIPILIYFDRSRVQPFLGLNYNYLATRMQTSTAGKYFSGSHNIGLNLGLGFRISELFSINMEYKHNLTSDFGQSISGVGGDTGNTVLGSSYNLKNAQAKLSIVYSLNKRKE
ncbi:MAG: porin family protein [Bacteroidetes bacterium]|nr:porin family protein [Bacteroidota bacterium]